MNVSAGYEFVSLGALLKIEIAGKLNRFLCILRWK